MAITPMSKAQVVAVGQKIHDEQGVTDPVALAAAIARAAPAGAIWAAIAAKEVVDVARKASGVVNAGADAVNDLAGVIREVADLPTRILQWLGEGGTWIRIAYVVGGGAMVLIGVAVFVKGTVSTVVGSEVGKVAGKALRGNGNG